MKREGDLESLTDGKLYRSSDMAKLGCRDCEGCSACCRGMGNSVVLDPYDVRRLSRGIGKTLSQMLGKEVLLSITDGLILPSLNMENETKACPFLNKEGRCSIYAFRPGICRLFPLGRYYHDGGFSYVLMTGECKKENRSKIKIEKWLGEPEIKKYEQFVAKWKTILDAAQQELEEIKIPAGMTSEEADEYLLKRQQEISVALLQKYYFTESDELFLPETGKKEGN